MTEKVLPDSRHGNHHRRVVEAAEELRRACKEHGVDYPMLTAWFASTPDLVETAGFVFDVTQVVPGRGSMRRLSSALEKRLDLGEPLCVDLQSPYVKVGRILRDCLAGILLVVCFWCVIGAILTGQNELARNTSMLMALGILIAAMTVLALLEAAHIGAVALSSADVSTLEHSHPRVYALHRHIDSKEKLESYLAARQVGVVLIVFLISELTRTVGLETLPGTSVPLPAAFDLLFRVGAPGALLVLIIGQVTPQIITARRPAAMMNTFPMAAAFHGTRLIGHLGLARPSSWLVHWSKASERIPSAPRERYVSNTVDVAGFGVLALHKTLVVSALETHAVTDTRVLFHVDGRTHADLQVATAPTTPTRLQVLAQIIRGSDMQPTVAEPVDDNRDQRVGGVALTSTFSPRIGSYQSGDVLAVTTSADFDERLTRDFLAVETPTKLATLRVVLEHPPCPLPHAVLTVAQGGDSDDTVIQKVPVCVKADGTAEVFVSLAYPDPGTVMGLAWVPDVQPRTSLSIDQPVIQELAS